MQRGPSDGRFKIRSDDFDTARRFNPVEVDPTLSSVSHLGHPLRPLEALDVRRERAVLARQHDGVTDVKGPAIQDDVNGLPHTNFVPHFQHGSLRCTKCIGQPVLQESLCKTDGYGEKVLQALTFFGRHRDQGHVLSEISYLVVPLQIEAVFRKLSDDFPVAVLKKRLHVVPLVPERFNEGTTRLTAPTVEPVNLVTSDDERRSGFLQNVE